MDRVAALGENAEIRHIPETADHHVTSDAPSGHVCGERRRAELREFLRTRRARISPERAGIAGGSRRRTPGLRREEVAVLAGVGVSWYQWLEQGRDITVSPQVLDAVARVLELNEAELRHLYVLAGLNPPLPTESAELVADGALLRLLDGWMPRPAHIVDRYWNVIAANTAANLVFDFDGAGENCLVSFFTRPEYRELYPDWEQLAAKVVASYRAEMLPYLGDTRFDAVIDSVTALSPEFAGLWAAHDVAPIGPVLKIVNHASAGELRLESTNLRVPAFPHLILTVHNPVTGSGTLEKVRALVDEHERRRGLRLA
jgi:transcriptional regulator with XRE-family HTH domain